MIQKKRAVELMEASPAVILTTAGKDGLLRSRAMLNLRRPKDYPSLVPLFKGHKEDLTVYFTTNTSSAKVEQIRENPQVSAYYCRAREWRGLSLSGKIEIIEDPEIREALWQEAWIIYYPGGVADPDYAVLRLRPVIAGGYHKMERYAIEF